MGEETDEGISTLGKKCALSERTFNYGMSQGRVKNNKVNGSFSYQQIPVPVLFSLCLNDTSPGKTV